MTEKLELVRGSGNVFRDLGHPRADVEQLKSILATEIIGVLDGHKLSVRKAESVTGINASEFFAHPQRSTWPLYGRPAHDPI